MTIPIFASRRDACIEAGRGRRHHNFDGPLPRLLVGYDKLVEGLHVSVKESRAAIFCHDEVLVAWAAFAQTSIG